MFFKKEQFICDMQTPNLDELEAPEDNNDHLLDPGRFGEWLRTGEEILLTIDDEPLSPNLLAKYLNAPAEVTKSESVAIETEPNVLVHSLCHQVTTAYKEVRYSEIPLTSQRREECLEIIADVCDHTGQFNKFATTLYAFDLAGTCQHEDSGSEADIEKRSEVKKCLSDVEIVSKATLQLHNLLEQYDTFENQFHVLKGSWDTTLQTIPDTMKDIYENSNRFTAGNAIKIHMPTLQQSVSVLSVILSECESLVPGTTYQETTLIEFLSSGHNELQKWTDEIIPLLNPYMASITHTLALFVRDNWIQKSFSLADVNHEAMRKFPNIPIGISSADAQFLIMASREFLNENDKKFDKKWKKEAYATFYS
eukprot:PhF_6_TR38134/c0_g1_i1/m.56945